MSKKITRRKELEFPYQDDASSFEIPKLNISKSLDDIPNPKYYNPQFDKKAKKEFNTEASFDKSNKNFKGKDKFNTTPSRPGKDGAANKKAGGHPFEKFTKNKRATLKDKIEEVSDDNKVYKSQPLGKRDKGLTYSNVEKNKKAVIEKNKSFEVMPLNKYLAKCGICSRREAVDIIKAKRVKVGTEIIDVPGFKIEEKMLVYLDDKKIVPQENKVYILLNKPKGYITTLDDPKGRRIISDLYKNQIKERIYPVGRLDRNTTGVILITNDGELSQQLTHPKYAIKKIYQVELDRKLSETDLKKIASGLDLEDGPIKVDDIAYLEDKKTIGVEIHSGRNRIVRRIFEHLGYTVEKLDRVFFAGLTKKNLMRGKWRFLTEQEVINLKHLGKRKVN